MFARFTPVALLSFFALIGVIISGVTVALALHQPWLGLTLAQKAETGEVWIAAAQRSDVAGPLPARLHSVGGIPVTSGDLVEEPDTLTTYTEMRAFFARQETLHGTLTRGPVVLDVANDGGEMRRVTITPQDGRPIADMPVSFWVQIFVGLAAYLVSIWVWSLRREDASTRLFALTGACIILFSHAAAIYSTRELAIDGTLFRALSIANHGGASGFGVSMIALLLTYPRRVVDARIPGALAALAGVWWLADSAHILFDGPPLGSHLITVLEMIGIFAAGGVQYAKAGSDPRARAVLRWFGLSVSVGAGIFVFAIVAPSLVGASPLFSQGYGFLSFLLIHAGLAVGVSRHRVFELDRWAFRIVFYLVGAILLVALDAVLILVVAIDRAPAFGFSLLAVAFLYLPFRDTLARRIGRAHGPDRGKWFQQVVGIALTRDTDAQNARWQALLQDIFAPLKIEPLTNVSAPALTAEGLEIAVPAADAVGAVRLAYAHGGRKLFTPRDVDLIGELHAMLVHAVDSRRAYEKGVNQERTRIARDMHDNIGVQLLGALHSQETNRKNVLIRETLSDLRDIINNASAPGVPPEDALADLRAEIADHLAAAGIALTWDSEVAPNMMLSPPALHALRSVIREAAGNVIKHAQASVVQIAISCSTESIVFVVEDNGRGFDEKAVARGNGLANMRARAAGLNGAFALTSREGDTRIEGTLDLSFAGAAQ